MAESSTPATACARTSAPRKDRLPEAEKRRRDRARSKRYRTQQINIGTASERWKQLKTRVGEDNDVKFAGILLDILEKSMKTASTAAPQPRLPTSTPLAAGPARGGQHVESISTIDPSRYDQETLTSSSREESSDRKDFSTAECDQDLVTSGPLRAARRTLLSFSPLKDQGSSRTPQLSTLGEQPPQLSTSGEQPPQLSTSGEQPPQPSTSGEQQDVTTESNSFYCVSLGTATFILAPDPRSQGGTDWAKETLIMPNGQDIREVDDRRNPLSTCEDNLNTTAFHSDSLEVTATILTETDIKQEPELENSVSVPEHIELSSESGDSEFDEEKESDGCESEPKTKRQKKVPKEDSDWAPSKDSSEESGESGESISEDSENSDESDYEHKRQKSQQHNPFQCLKCDREYEIHMELCTHIVKEHTTEESRQVDVCVLCTKPWTPALLGKHMREVHGVEDFVDWSADNNLQCTRCSNIHQDVLSFLFHLEDAHRTTAVKCSKCEFTSIYTYQLFRHMAKKHGCMDQENVVVTNKRPVYRKGTVIGTAIDPVTCALCGATPGINLNKHIQAEHPEALALHKYSCYICPSVSPSYNVLRGHFRARHNGRQCCFCPFSCRHRSLMEDHVWMKHLNITKYTCKLCHTPLHFTRKCRYLVHTKRVHEGKKDYLCHECGKSFKTSSSFQIHYRQHTGEKPIMCTECGFRCRQPNSLNWHKKKHHPK